MTRRTILIAASLAALAGSAFANMVTYTVTVGTAGLTGGGFIDLEFNQANALTSLSGLASVNYFQANGLTLGSTTFISPGVSGSFAAPPVLIPNHQSAANFYTQEVLNWGTSFDFILTLSGPAVNGAAPDGSTFFVNLLDPSFNFIGNPSGEVASVVLNPDTTITVNSGPFAGGFSNITPGPEPGSLTLLGLVLAALAWSGPRRFNPKSHDV